MSERVRLGDYIDDYCARCRRLTDHAIVAIVGDAVKKVRCRTCYNEHDYRQGKPSERKKAKPSAFDQVLASITTTMPVAAQPPEKTKRSRKGAPRDNR